MLSADFEGLYAQTLQTISPSQRLACHESDWRSISWCCHTGHTRTCVSTGRAQPIYKSNALTLFISQRAQSSFLSSAGVLGHLFLPDRNFHRGNQYLYVLLLIFADTMVVPRSYPRRSSAKSWGSWLARADSRNLLCLTVSDTSRQNVHSRMSSSISYVGYKFRLESMAFVTVSRCYDSDIFVCQPPKNLKVYVFDHNFTGALSNSITDIIF